MSLQLPDSGAQTASDGRRTAPSAERNAHAILQILLVEAPRHGRLLEIASGTGQHAGKMSQAFPKLKWQPTDLNPENFASILAWTKTIPSVLPPMVLNAASAGWAKDFSAQDVILLVNLLHLISASAVETLLAEAGQALAPGGVALFYGPFLRQGQTTSDGDLRFDASLRAQDPEIGYKDLDWVTNLLTKSDLQVTTREMPANNVMVIAARP